MALAGADGFHLYGISGAASLIAEFLLTSAGVKYRISFPDQAERASPEYRAISPKGQVPVLVDEEGNSFSESLAITFYLLERFPSTNLIAPINHPAHGKCLQWLAYLATILYNANQRMYQGYSFSGDNEMLRESGLGDRRASYDELNTALAHSAFLAGDQISAADLYLYMLLTWDRNIDDELSSRPHLTRVYHAVADLPYVKQVMAHQSPDHTFRTMGPEGL